MHEALHRFHSAKLKPFEVNRCLFLHELSRYVFTFIKFIILYEFHCFQDRVQREFSAVSQHLTSHLNQLLTTAYRKFAVWQQRKMQMR